MLASGVHIVVYITNQCCKQRQRRENQQHYSDVTMGSMGSQITSLTIVCLTVYSGADQRKHQSSAPLAFVGNSPVAGEFPAQMASNVENVSIWWRHHDKLVYSSQSWKYEQRPTQLINPSPVFSDTLQWLIAWKCFAFYSERPTCDVHMIPRMRSQHWLGHKSSSAERQVSI